MTNLTGIFIFYLFLRSFLKYRLTVFLTLLLLLRIIRPTIYMLTPMGFRWLLWVIPFYTLWMFIRARYKNTVIKKNKGNDYLIILTGILAGSAFWYSQEVGVVSIIAIVFVLLVLSNLYEDSAVCRYKSLFLYEGLFFIGICIISLPILWYFIAQHGLLSLISDMVKYSRYVMLGYANEFFPNIIGMGNIFPYKCSLRLYLYDLAIIFQCWFLHILLFIIVSVHLSICGIIKKWSMKNTIILGILLLAILQFRKTLGRATLETVLPASFILCAIMAEELFIRIKTMGRKINFQSGLYSVAFTSIVFICLDCLTINYLIVWKTKTIQELWNLGNTESGTTPLLLERAQNIYIGRKRAEQVRNVVNYIKDNTDHNDYIYTFPNEPMYYFLTDRLNPSRFNWSYWAATSEWRKEVVEDLKIKKPKYVIYNLDKWRFDGISERAQVPEITRHIEENYSAEKEFEGVKILQYKEKP